MSKWPLIQISRLFYFYVLKMFLMWTTFFPLVAQLVKNPPAMQDTWV